MGMDHVFGCVTIAEMKDFRMMCEIADAIKEDPIAEREVFRGIGDGKRTEAVMVEAYDSEMAELIADHVAEKCHVRNRRKGDRKHPENKAERMRNRARRERTIYGDMDGNGKRKDSYINGELYRDGKCRVAEFLARADWELEQKNHADAMAEYRDYIRMVEDHEERLDALENKTGSVEYWGIMEDEISREKIYETNRIRQMNAYANSIYADEQYFRDQKSFGIDAGVYQRMIAREYKEWLKWA